MERQAPNLSNLRELLNFKPIDLNRRRARINSATTINDLRKIARRRTPKAAFDYVDGGSFSEATQKRNREAFEHVEFVPQVLQDVTSVDLSGSIAGTEFSMPVGIAPTGLTRLAHAEGEIAGRLAAAAAGIPFALSTMGTTSIEDVSAAAPAGDHWFQLYLWKDRARSLELIERAAKAGYSALIITVDTPVGGARYRDVKNGMTLPPTLSLKTILDASYRPEWWINFLTTEPLGFANFDSSHGSVSEQANAMFDASLNFKDLAWLRNTWHGKLIVKGIQTPTDAERAFAAGADAIVVSNHGGRQLDRAPVPFLTLPAIREKVGPDAEIIMDSGIMSGGDIIAGIAAGANFTLIGRAYLYALMAGGQEGVDRALQILATEMKIIMQLLGVNKLADLTADHIRSYPPTAPWRNSDTLFALGIPAPLP